ncbi:DUF3102 domain-containing protein [Acaryochloris marina NIES-2412]|uniref:DUF3102 domain-containing protein n=1 Tax=Acaryochloris marina TaxID=155978 RepID=UPI004059C5F8
MAKKNDFTHLPKIECQSFNYDLLDPDTREFVEKQASEIKQIYARTLRDAWEAGRLLLEVKDKLEHGQFCRWVADELGLSKSTACNQMHLARNFKSATIALMDLPISTCYELARTSTPSSARDEVIQRSQSGEKFTTKKAREIITRHKSQLSLVDPDPRSEAELDPSDATIDVLCADVTSYPDNVIHFRTKSQNRLKRSSGTFHAISLFTSLNSISLQISLQIMESARDGRKSC